MLTCQHCGYRWAPRKPLGRGRRMVRCPRCERTVRVVGFAPVALARTMRCESCGYVWRPRVERPKACPGCKGYILHGGKEEAACPTS